MTIEELRERIIEEGIASVHRLETQPHKIRGCLAGFEIARTLPIEAFEETIANRERQRMEIYRGASSSTADVETYWEYTCATAQIQHVWERLRIVLGKGSDRVSGNAYMHVARLLGLAPEAR